MKLLKKSFALLMAVGLMGAVMSCGEEPTTSSSSTSSTISTPSQPAVDTIKQTGGQIDMPVEGETIVVLDTSEGIIKIKLLPEYAPKAVENFATHVHDAYYDGLKFHRVIQNFMIQTGDPNGIGTGGESIWGAPFEDEISPDASYIKYSVAMANAGPNTNGSQFFISSVDNTLNLAPNYSIFGQVFEGMDVVDKIEATPVDAYDMPTKEVKINKAYLEVYKPAA